MFILTTQPESYFKDKIDYFYVSSLKIKDDFQKEHGDKNLMFEGILMNQEIRKTVKNKLRYTKSKKKYLIYSITEFEEDIVENIKNFYNEEGHVGGFMTTKDDLINCTSNVKRLFDNTIF